VWPFRRRQPDSPKHKFKAGTKALRKQDFAQAIESLSAVCEAEPDNAAAAANLGMAYFRVGQYEAALQHLERAREHDSRNPKILLNLAAANNALDRVDEATDLLLRTLEIDPQHRDCHYNL